MFAREETDENVIATFGLFLGNYEHGTVTLLAFYSVSKDANDSYDFAFTAHLLLCAVLTRVTDHHRRFGMLLAVWTTLDAVYLTFFVERQSLYLKLTVAIEHLCASLYSTHAAEPLWQPSDSLEWLQERRVAPVPALALQIQLAPGNNLI